MKKGGKTEKGLRKREVYQWDGELTGWKRKEERVCDCDKLEW